MMSRKVLCGSVVALALAGCGGGGGSNPPDYTGKGYTQWTVASGGNGHWYKATTNAAVNSWTDAEKACEADGGHLATLTSAEENAFVFTLVDQPSLWQLWNGNHGIGFWIGGHAPEPRATPDTGWTWVTGEPWSYTSWVSGDPGNGSGIEDELLYASTDTQPQPNWGDFSSQETAVHTYVSEIDSFHPVTN